MIDFTKHSMYIDLCETVVDDVNEEVALYGNSKGIARIDMPQIKTIDIPEFITFLKDLGVDSKKEQVKVISLKPTQKEFNPDKVSKLQTAPLSVLNKTIIKSKDNFILDGHHRFSALLGINTNAKMNVISVNVNISQLLKHAAKFPKTFKKDINDK